MTAHDNIDESKKSDQRLRECQQSLQDYLDNANDLILNIAPDGHLLYGNRKWRETFGYSEQDLIRFPITNIVHPEHRAEHEAAWQHLLAGETLNNYESVHLTRDGRSIPVTGNIRPQSAKRHPPAMQAILCESTDLLRATRALQKAQHEATRRRLELEAYTRETELLNQLGVELQTCKSTDQAYHVISRMMPLLFPDASGAVCIFTAARDLLEAAATWGNIQPKDCVFHPEDCLALHAGQLHCVEEPAFPLPCLHLGEARPAQYLCAPLMGSGEVLGLLHLRSGKSRASRPEGSGAPVKESMRPLAVLVTDRISLALDILKEREALLKRPARDPLTKLFTKIYMQEMLKRELQRATRHKRPVGIAILDIDHFYKFNESYGRDAGDIMLREFAKNLAAQIRAEDVTCRYGGEEFVIILPEASLDVIRRRAQQLNSRSKQLKVKAKGETIGGLALSIGVAAFPEHGMTAEALLWAADQALHDAKVLGRDRVVVAQAFTSSN